MTLTVELRQIADGSGPPIILGHGITLDHRSVQRVAEALAARGHRILLWELPGHGNAPPAGRSWSVEALGAALASAIRLAELAPPVLIGTSMGGYASLEAAGGRAELDVRALMLISCTGAPAPAVDVDRLAALVTWAAGGALCPSEAQAMAVAELGADHPGIDGLRHTWSSDPTCGPRFLPGYLALLNRPDPALAAAVVAIRGAACAVVRGTDDPWVPRDGAFRLRDLLDARLHEVEGAAHQPQHTHTDAVVDAITSLLLESGEV
jgi:pimeloyl-ACP methyl ester carboxylesterase